MRFYRCLSCTCAFAIFLTRKGPNNAGGKGISCPLCKGAKVEEIDPVESLGATLARKAWKFWKSLPPGD